MRPIFDPEELTLMTDKESSLYDRYIEECGNYLNGKGDGVKMKQASVQMANITRLVQTRSATALLKYNVLRQEGSPLGIGMLNKPNLKE